MPNPINSPITNINTTASTPVEKDNSSTLKSQAKAIKIITIVGAVALTILGIVAAVLVPASIPFVAVGLLGVGAFTAVALNLEHILDAIEKRKAKPEAPKLEAPETTTSPQALKEEKPVTPKTVEATAPESESAKNHRKYLEQCDDDIAGFQERLDRAKKHAATPFADKKHSQDVISHFTGKIEMMKKEKIRADEVYQNSQAKKVLT